MATSDYNSERREERVPRRDVSDATSDFNISEIRFAKAQFKQKAPLFLVSRGLQKGRPIPVREGQRSVGRATVCDVSVQGRGVSRTHMLVKQSPDKGVTICDADSTNGLYVNGQRVREHILRDGDVVQLGPDLQFTFSYVLASEIPLRMRQYEQSVIDDSTGIHNRRYLMESLEHQVAFAVHHNQPLHVLIVDIDRFKRINFEFGHQAGDEVLKQIAKLIATTLRSEDTIARLNSDEFAIVTRGMSAEQAAAHADRLRKTVEKLPIFVGGAADSMHHLRWWRGSYRTGALQHPRTAAARRRASLSGEARGAQHCRGMLAVNFANLSATKRLLSVWNSSVKNRCDRDHQQ